MRFEMIDSTWWTFDEWCRMMGNLKVRAPQMTPVEPRKNCIFLYNQLSFYKYNVSRSIQNIPAGYIWDQIFPDWWREVFRRASREDSRMAQKNWRELGSFGLDWPHPVSITHHIFSSHSRKMPDQARVRSHWGWTLDERIIKSRKKEK